MFIIYLSESVIDIIITPIKWFSLLVFRVISPSFTNVFVKSHRLRNNNRISLN